MPKWTPSEIDDQTGRRVVVTGANSGLGFHASLELARRGAHVTLACRSTEKGEEALARLLEEAPGSAARLRRLDLADLASVRDFAESYDEPIDLLINNAGVMALPRRETADGFEMQLGTNHLGHYALTGLLLPRLLESESDARVVTVSSGAHRMGRMGWDNLQGQRRYQRWLAYGQSKLANLLFMRELQRRADADDANLLSVAAHPGYAATNLQFAGARMEGSGIKERIAGLGNKLMAQSDAQGAWPLLFAATEEIPGGAYAGPDGPGEMRGHPHLVSMSSRASSEEDAARLWKASEELTGVKYQFIR
jgi:NAD(P)-dependent dehydrogenase (short-subunit alcohol dehydrogenase family)